VASGGITTRDPIFEHKVAKSNNGYEISFATVYRYQVSNPQDEDELKDMRISCLLEEAVLTEWLKARRWERGGVWEWEGRDPGGKGGTA
jgi:hypothetical protein